MTKEEYVLLIEQELKNVKDFEFVITLYYLITMHNNSGE
jgi:hypothetical protein